FQLVKYNSQGVIQWNVPIWTTIDPIVFNIGLVTISADSSANIYVKIPATYIDVVTYGTDESFMKFAGNGDVLVKYDSLGIIQWSKLIPSHIGSMISDKKNNFYISSGRGIFKM